MFSSQADGSPLSLDQQLRGREKPKILHPIPHVGGKYKDQKIILLVPLITILSFCSYVGILSGYAISLVAWSWYTDCADCPKVSWRSLILIELTNFLEISKKLYCTFPSQDIRLKQSRILHSVLLIMESVIRTFDFWLLLVIIISIIISISNHNYPCNVFWTPKR